MTEISNMSLFMSVIVLAMCYTIYTDYIQTANHQTPSGGDYDEMDDHATYIDMSHSSDGSGILADEQLLQNQMEVVTRVKAECEFCADNMCTLECQKKNQMCESMMGHGYYPNKTPCPLGGSEPGVPSPYDIYANDDVWSVSDVNQPKPSTL